MAPHEITLILITHSRSRVLEIVELAISTDSSKLFEWIVVLDGSLREESFSFDHQLHGHIKLIYSKVSRKIGALRNVGIKNSSGSLICFLDDDCTPAPDFLSNLSKITPDIQIARGAIIFKGSDIFSTVDAKLRTLRYSRDNNVAYTPNLVVRKSFLLQKGLFDEDFRYGSDGEFSDRVVGGNGYVKYVSNLVIEHSCSSGLIPFVKKYFRYGEGRSMRWKKARQRNQKIVLFPHHTTSSLSCVERGVIYLGTMARIVGTIWGFGKSVLSTQPNGTHHHGR